MYRLYSKGKSFTSVGDGITAMIVLAFIMCFITLMLADCQSDFDGGAGERKSVVLLNQKKHSFKPSNVKHKNTALRRLMYEIENEDKLKLSRSLNTDKDILPKRSHRNWTHMVQQWQQGARQRNYTYLINNINICRGLTGQKIVILVYSATNNFKKRLALRETWADPRITVRKRFSVVFLLGKTNAETEQQLVNAESKKYGDIAQGNFLDTYQNLTYKGLFGFQWVMDFCQNARLVLKVDDDVALDVFKILETYSDTSYERGLLACQVREKGSSPILRDGRWKLDDKYFPGLTHYNFRHCNGYFVMMSPDVVKDLLTVSEHEPKLWIDDVYLFGLLPSKINSVNMSQLEEVLSLYEDASMACFSDVTPCRLLMGYTYNQGSLQKLWRLIIMNSYALIEKYGNLGYIFMKLVKLLYT